jgi:hypothetical protein
MPDDIYQALNALIMTWKTYPNLYFPKNFSKRGKLSYFELDIMLLGLRHGVEVPLL